MNKLSAVVAAYIIVNIISGCNKKSVPAETPVEPATTVSVTKAPDSLTVKKPAAKPKPKPMATTPKVIVVNDAGAKRAVDGRLYYDMQGKRYWRSNKDGKYYLYNKSMHSDPAFKAPPKKSA